MNRILLFGAIIFCLARQSNAQTLVVSEINFHSDSLLNSGDWIEIFNASAATINLSGWTLEDESLNGKYTFPTAMSIAAGGRLVLFEDNSKFNAIHPTVTNKLGPLPFGLSNNGERLILKDLQGNVVQDFTFKDGPKWQCSADGFGRTLELRTAGDDPGEPESWFAGCIGGSPGKAYSACADLPTISEINYNSATASDAGDWFEILNPNTAALNLSGWRVRDSDDNNLYTVPSGTSVAAGGRLVFFGDAAKFSAQHPSVSNKIGPLGFGLAASSDAVRLYDASGRLQNSVCYLDTLPWPMAADGGGKTLEFKTGQSPTEPSSWFAGCPGGSPGKAFTPSDCGFISADDFSAENLKLEIFPNPAEDFVFLKIGGDAAVSSFDFQVFDAAGRLVLQRLGFENGGRLAVFDLPRGVFQLVCLAGERRFLGRFVR